MTTLPQTTNVRLPRPMNGAIQVAAPGGGGLLAGGGAAAAQQGASDMWRVIRTHIWLILIVTCIIAPAAGYGVNFFLARNYPRYTSTALIEVQPKVQQVDAWQKGMLPMTDPAMTALEIRTQAAILRSESLLTKVLQNANSDVRRTQWFAQFNNNIAKAKADFEESLTVTPVQDTKLVKVEFTYSKPEDCRSIVFDLISTHLENQKQTQVNALLDRTTVLNNSRIKIEASLKILRADMQEKAVRLNMDGGAVGAIGSRLGTKDVELTKLVQEQVEAQLMSGKAQGTLKAVTEAIQQGQDPPGMDVLIQHIAPFLMNDQYNLRQMEIRRDLLADQYGPENAKYKAAVKECELMRSAYEAQLAETKANAKVQILEGYQQEAAAAEAKLKSLTTRVDNLKQDMGELSNSMVKYYTLQQEERGLVEQLKQVKEQIDGVMALSSARAAEDVVWRAMPEIPMNKSFPKLWIIMALAITVGLALSLGIAFLREAMDQSIRSPRDIAKIGQINLLGLIPDESDDPQSAGARLPVVIFDAPHSVMAESFRHVRTKLQHTASLDTTRSIMVTSPSPGDGKTTIACNLAAGLALNGRRILLVDANFRRPEVHRIFGLPNEQGFSDVLNAVAAFDEVLQETQVPNLAVMSAGPKPMNPTELFESQLLIDFIDRALEEFDHVIFDSGPLMVVAEAQAMAPRVDGVVSVVRAKTNNRGLLQRMRDELRKNKAEHLGVVLNAVRAQGGGYYRKSIQTYYDYANNGRS
jgi:succinoglycan biosynthesis transport protein ExoP